MGSRTAFVTGNGEDARELAQKGLRRQAENHRASGQIVQGDTLDDYIRAFDVHLGTAAQVTASLQADTALARVTDLAFQVHSIDPPHPYILRSIELIARHVAPALGWVRRTPSRAVSTSSSDTTFSKEIQ